MQGTLTDPPELVYAHLFETQCVSIYSIKESNRKYTDLVKAKAGQVHMSTQFHMWTLPPPAPHLRSFGEGHFHDQLKSTMKDRARGRICSGQS